MNCKAPIVALLLAGSAFATCAQVGAGGSSGMARAEQMRTELHKRFATADVNVDGHLTRDEAKGKMPWVYRNFDAIDTSHSGSVTMEQIEAYAMSQRQKAN
jgi:hypothetical protein